MKKYNVTFTTYEEYEVEAENEAEALRIAENKLNSDRCTPIADTHYDKSNVEEIEDKETQRS